MTSTHSTNGVRRGGLHAILSLGAVVPCIMAAGVTASAQSVPAADVSVGYTFLTDGDTNFPIGFFGDVGVSVGENVQVVGEVARHLSTQTDFGIDVDLRETSFLVGPRFVLRTDALTGYFQALVGGANVSGGASAFGFDVSVSTTVLALQVGGGLVAPMSETVGFRVGADLQVLRSDELGSSTQFKVSGGVSFSLGRR